MSDLRKWMVAAMAGAVFTLAACDTNEGPFEEAGENIDEAADDVGDAVEDIDDR